MPVSSETLFHFTKTFSNLKSILANKFRIAYCKEQYVIGIVTHTYYIPMLSFCDIPLSLAKDQIRKYGSYVIGMNKEWAVRNRLNPVIYVEKNSFLSSDIDATLKSLLSIANASLIYSAKRRNAIELLVNDALPVINDFKNLDIPNKNAAVKCLIKILGEIKQQTDELIELKPVRSSLREIVNTHVNLFRYIKNYKGSLERIGSPKKQYSFYDEREWRFIPEITDPRLKSSLSDIEYKSYRGESEKKPFIPNVRLEFSLNDIEYLIVKSSKEIKGLQKYIRSNALKRKDDTDIDLLTTKVISFENIYKDF